MAERFEIDTAHMGNSAVHDGAIGTSVLVLAYYHFSRYHESLRVRLEEPIARKGKQRAKEYRKMTPAVAAGLTSRHWSVMELISYPLP
jgi:hypothetical protein